MSGYPSRRRLLLVAQFIVSVGLLSWLLAQLDLQQAWGRARTATPMLILAGTTASVAALLAQAGRLHAVLRKAELSLPIGVLFRTVWIGQFFNSLLPGSTGGDAYRLAVLWSTYPRQKGRAILAIFVDRGIATGLLAVAALASLAVLPVWPLVAQLQLPRITRGALVVGVSVSILAAALGLSRTAWRERARAIVESGVARLREAVELFRWDRDLVAIIAWALLVHALNFLVFYCFANAVGLHLSVGQVVLILPPLLLILFLPVSINGHGVREVVLIGLLTMIAVSPPVGVTLAEAILSLSVVGVALEILLGLVGGALLLVGRRRVVSYPPSEIPDLRP